MERLRLESLNLKEDGNGISIGEKLHEVMDADLRILCSSSHLLSRENVYLLGDSAEFCFSEHFPF